MRAAPPTRISPLSLHDALPISSLKGNDQIDMLYVHPSAAGQGVGATLCDALEKLAGARGTTGLRVDASRSEEHTSELQSRGHLVCRLLLEKKNRRPHAGSHGLV